MYLLRPELKTFEWDILNPDYLIWVFNGNAFDFIFLTIQDYQLEYYQLYNIINYTRLSTIQDYQLNKIINYTRLSLTYFYVI